MKIPKIKVAKTTIIIAGAIVGVFVLFKVITKVSGHTGAKGQKGIRLFRGRSNYYGTRLGSRQSFKRLQGNRTQKKLSRKAIRLMGRS